jgi:hypothetical protein
MIQSNFTDDKRLRRQGRGSSYIFLLLGGLILLGGGLLLGWQVLGRQSSPQNSTHIQANTSSAANQSVKGTPPEVAEYVRQHIAQGLHLSTEHFITKLRIGVAIGSLATQQGLTADQLRTLEVNTYQVAYDRLISDGKITRQDANIRMSAIRSYPQTELDYLVATDCLGSPPQE